MRQNINKDYMYDFLKEPTKEKFRILGEQNLGEKMSLILKKNGVMNMLNLEK